MTTQPKPDLIVTFDAKGCASHWPLAPIQESLCTAGHWTPGLHITCPLADCVAAIKGKVDLAPIPAERWRSAWAFLDSLPERESPDWMPLYVTRRLAHPEESPAAQEAEAKAEWAQRHGVAA